MLLKCPERCLSECFQGIYSGELLGTPDLITSEAASTTSYLFDYILNSQNKLQHTW